MARVSEAAKLYTPAQRVWQTVGDFDAIAGWHPAVLGCESASAGARSERRLDIGADAPVVETLEAHDDSRMAYRYTQAGGPLAAGGLAAELRVKPDDANSCTVEWSAELEPPPENADEGETVAAVRDFFRRGLEHLRFTLAG